MHENRHKCRSFIKLPVLIAVLAMTLGNCTIYTINKSDLENKLKPKEETKNSRGLSSLTTMYKKTYCNNMDTLKCLDAVGKVKTKRFKYDSRITIVTHKNQTIKFYAKTLYIWKEEYLIGERTNLTLYGPNYFPVKLNDISRIEVKKPWF